jgi:hypothetical protein
VRSLRSLVIARSELISYRAKQISADALFTRAALTSAVSPPHLLDSVATTLGMLRKRASRSRSNRNGVSR